MSLAADNPEAFLAAFLFAMLRAGGAFAVAPVFAALGLPLPVRILAAGVVAVVVMQISPPTPPPLLSIAGVLAAGGELLIGLALGFILQLSLAGAMLAGEQIASSAGLGFAAFADPQSGAQSPIIGQLLALVATLLFIAVDGHLALVETIVRSYRALPPGSFLATARIGDIAHFGGFVFLTGFMIALPVTVALFAVNLSLAILTRAAPQMNIFAVGLPISVTAAMAMLALALPALVELMEGAIGVGLDRMQAIGAG